MKEATNQGRQTVRPANEAVIRQENKEGGSRVSVVEKLEEELEWEEPHGHGIEHPGMN